MYKDKVEKKYYKFYNELAKFHKNDKASKELLALNEMLEKNYPNTEFKDLPDKIKEELTIKSIKFYNSNLDFVIKNTEEFNKISEAELKNLQKQFNNFEKTGVINNKNKAGLIIACIFTLGLALAIKKVRNRLKFNSHETVSPYMFTNKLRQDSIFSRIKDFIEYRKNLAADTNNSLKYLLDNTKDIFNDEKMKHLIEANNVGKKLDKLVELSTNDSKIEGFTKKYEQQVKNLYNRTTQR